MAASPIPRSVLMGAACRSCILLSGRGLISPEDLLSLLASGRGGASGSLRIELRGFESGSCRCCNDGDDDVICIDLASLVYGSEGVDILSWLKLESPILSP